MIGKRPGVVVVVFGEEGWGRRSRGGQGSCTNGYLMVITSFLLSMVFKMLFAIVTIFKKANLSVLYVQ